MCWPGCWSGRRGSLPAGAPRGSRPARECPAQRVYGRTAARMTRWAGGVAHGAAISDGIRPARRPDRRSVRLYTRPARQLTCRPPAPRPRRPPPQAPPAPRPRPPPQAPAAAPGPGRPPAPRPARGSRPARECPAQRVYGRAAARMTRWAGGVAHGAAISDGIRPARRPDRRSVRLYTRPARQLTCRPPAPRPGWPCHPGGATLAVPPWRCNPAAGPWVTRRSGGRGVAIRGVHGHRRHRRRTRAPRRAPRPGPVTAR